MGNRVATAGVHGPRPDPVARWRHHHELSPRGQRRVQPALTGAGHRDGAGGDRHRYLLEDGQLERLVIPCNDGNHGRLTEKTRSATRKENSLEWLLYIGLQREFARDPRVQFQIADGTQLFLDVYGRTIRFTHGDSVKYGGGIGGITIPIYKALARWDTVRHADLTIMGHFHQRISLSDLIVNGSLIGYSPYAMDIGARFEPPAQEFSMLEPVRFRSASIPLHVSDREDDDAYREAA